MKHKIVLDVRIGSNLSDHAQGESATRIFGMMNDFCAVVRDKTGVAMDATMFSTPTNPVVGDAPSITRVQDYCTHAFEIVPDDSADIAHVRCIKCGSRFEFDDTIPEGTHRHMLNVDMDTSEITCDRCDDMFEPNLDSVSMVCEHQLTVDIAKHIAVCSLCETVFDIEEFGSVEIISDAEEEGSTNPQTAETPKLTIDHPIAMPDGDVPPYEDGVMD